MYNNNNNSEKQFKKSTFTHKHYELHSEMYYNKLFSVILRLAVTMVTLVGKEIAKQNVAIVYKLV